MNSWICVVFCCSQWSKNLICTCVLPWLLSVIAALVKCVFPSEKECVHILRDDFKFPSQDHITWLSDYTWPQTVGVLCWETKHQSAERSRCVWVCTEPFTCSAVELVWKSMPVSPELFWWQCLVTGSRVMSALRRRLALASHLLFTQLQRRCGAHTLAASFTF